jgi:hypothetical protein
MRATRTDMQYSVASIERRAQAEMNAGLGCLRLALIASHAIWHAPDGDFLLISR